MLYGGDLDVIGTSDGIGRFFRQWPELIDHGRHEVPPVATAFVGSLLREPGPDGAVRTGLLRPTLAVDVVRLGDADGAVVVAAFERFRVRDPVRAAAKRYRLTDRERQVLALLLTGLAAAAVAARLGLAEPTVHDYVKRLRHKTGARTFSGMLARLLGWSGPEPLLGFADPEDPR